MIFFSPRRSRFQRLSVHKVGTSWSGRLGDQLSRTDVSLRLSICFVVLAGLMLSLQSWQAPFPYRLGDDFPNGMVARVDFKRVNQGKTDVARIEAVSRVPPVFRVLPAGVERLRNLPNDLRRHLFELVEVNKFSELSAETRAAFGWVAPGPSAIDPLTQKFEAEWNTLREAIGPIASAERKIDELVGEFSQLTTPVKKVGILDISELARPLQKIRLDDEINIVENETDKPLTRSASDAVLDELLKATGILGSQWKSFPSLLPLQPILERWFKNRAIPSLEFDQAATNIKIAEANEKTEPVEDEYKRGQLLIAPGSIIKSEELNVLHAQYDELESKVTFSERIVRMVSVFLLLTVLAGLNGFYLVRNERRLAASVGRLTVYLLAITTSIALSRLLSFDPWRAQVVPLLCTVMVLAIAYNQVLAALTGFSMTLVLTLAIGGGLGQFVVLMSAIAASVVPLNQVSNRMKLVRVGFGAAITFLFVSLGTGIIETQQLSRLWSDPDQRFLLNILRGAGWCFLSGFLVSGSLPFIESLFGVVTDISLLELSDVSHPLLQELIQKAPGTYSHSNGVATIAETAADAIGANGLLCRVGAYYHDIGKIMKPHYFVENMTAGQTSRHESLNPAMSALVIIGHVKDGVELAHQHNLPEPLIDFIEQHHGTTLVEYFFHAATKQAESQPDHRFDVEESAFRYPGRKPQTREAAVLMVADAVEGASRTLAEPTPKRLETLVHEIAMKRLLDGQFEESSLTLSELATIEDSLTKSLIGIHHGRIKYPEQKTA
ncbi:HD family phosphohydrolase [Schlesneria paludicola]|uniref:HD family phosphohydrolase n=1 Tax=Schlesneria paludicola TaxID=360056 RepID=UPI000299F371|nr:HDIG domain-containing metalloprotein [Schlesneria paludicola]